MKLVIALILCVAGATQALGNERVAVIVGPHAPEIEKHAARELCQYLDRLFAIKATPTTDVGGSPENVFLVGSPTTNPLIRKDEFPEVSDQGIVIKSGKAGLI